MCVRVCVCVCVCVCACVCVCVCVRVRSSVSAKYFHSYKRSGAITHLHAFTVRSLEPRLSQFDFDFEPPSRDVTPVAARTATRVRKAPGAKSNGPRGGNGPSVPSTQRAARQPATARDPSADLTFTAASATRRGPRQPASPKKKATSARTPPVIGETREPSVDLTFSAAPPSPVIKVCALAEGGFLLCLYGGKGVRHTHFFIFRLAIGMCRRNTCWRSLTWRTITRGRCRPTLTTCLASWQPKPRLVARVCVCVCVCLCVIVVRAIDG